MAYSGLFNTDKLSEVLRIPSIGSVWIDTSKDENVKGYGMIHNRPHTEAAKKKMREVGKPSLHKGGIVISPTGEIIKFECLTHFCKRYGLSTGHMCELLKNKRKTVKGWKNGTTL